MPPLPLPSMPSPWSRPIGCRHKSPEEIRALLTRAGVAPNQQVVTYCQMGMRASLMLFALRAAGVNARVYLPGWEGWTKDHSNPIIR